MKKNIQKCSSKEHLDIDAISYCEMCQIYMCTECQNIHLKLCPNHCPHNLIKDLNEKFTGICQEENHFKKLEYFCKTHNKSCCVACISKIKGRGNGQHTDCDVCYIDEINDEKNKLNDNIKSLEDLSNSLNESINE